MKSVILAQIQNSYEYMPAFLAHHLRLVDKIIILDHNSSRELRDIRHEKIETHRISSNIFAQELYSGFFVKKLGLKDEFDFLFIIDVDEFLPFQSKEAFDEFLKENAGKAAMSMFWRNGFSSTETKLDAKATFRFTKWRSSTKKLIYNLKRLGDILPSRGNHNARYPICDSLVIQRRPKRHDSGLGLLHIPFLGLNGLRKKITDYPSARYRDRILRDLPAMGIHRDPQSDMIDFSDQELMTLVANYRLDPATMHPDVSLADFEEIAFLDGLDEDIRSLSRQIGQCRPAVVNPPADDEDVVSGLRKNRISYSRRLAKAFNRQPDGSYAFHSRMR